MRFLKAFLALLLGLAPVVVAAPLHAREAAAAPARSPALQRFDATIETTKQAMMGDPMVARKAAEQAVRLARGLAADPTVSPKDAAISLATAQWLLGEAMIGLNDTAHAKSLIGEALAAVQKVDPNSKLNGDLLRSRAALAESAGDVQGALKDYLQAYRIFRAAGQARSTAIALQDVGNLYLEAKDFDRVRSYYSQSIEAYSKDPWLNLATYNNRGQSYREQQRFAEAEREYALALTSARELKSPLLEARILTNLADAQLEGGNPDRAARTIAAAGGLVQSGEGIGWRPFVFGVRAKIAARRGALGEAAGLFAQAFAGQDLTRTEMPFRELHHTAASVYERLGDKDLALAHLKAFQRLDSEALNLIASASSQLMTARFDFANQDLRIANLKRGQLERDITIERQRTRFRTNIFAGLGTALLVIFGLLSFGYVSIRKSRDKVRAANAELSTTNVALEKALKARTDFLATTSHEIRTPLNGIMGMTQVLLADRRLAEDVRERVEVLQAAGETMKSLVDDILDVAKMEAGEPTLALGEVDVSRLLNETFGLWREAAKNKGLTLDWSLDSVPAHVTTDGSRLRQILSNLLSNAVKFTNEGGVTVDIRGCESEGGILVEFAVRDTGVGIPADALDTIFEAFTQVNNSTTREFSGTGLGLAITERLVKALGGTIAVTSEPDKGSCFTVSLPVQSVGTELASTSTPTSTAGATRFDAAAVLLVERNLANHPLMRMLLTPETRSIDIAVSAEDAIARMQDARFDHVVIEGASAAGDGEAPIDAIRRIIEQARASGIRTSLLAAPSDALSAAQLLAAGADQVILKPIGAAELIAALKRSYDADGDGAGGTQGLRSAAS